MATCLSLNQALFKPLFLLWEGSFGFGGPVGEGPMRIQFFHWIWGKIWKRQLLGRKQDGIFGWGERFQHPKNDWEGWYATNQTNMELEKHLKFEGKMNSPPSRGGFWGSSGCISCNEWLMEIGWLILEQQFVEWTTNCQVIQSDLLYPLFGGHLAFERVT